MARPDLVLGCVALVSARFHSSDRPIDLTDLTWRLFCRPDLHFGCPGRLLGATLWTKWRQLGRPDFKNTNSAAEGHQNQESRTFDEMSSKSRSRYQGKSIQRAKNDAQGAHLVPKGSQMTLVFFNVLVDFHMFGMTSITLTDRSTRPT